MKMKNTISKKSVSGKRNLILKAWIILFFISLIAHISPVSAQPILFNFDNAPLYSSLPLYQTEGGITAHLIPTGGGYSIQNANALGFTPQGFSGRIIYPNSVYGADLLIHFDHTITDFSIMCCTQELGCDDAATVRVTAYMNGTYTGYSDQMATCPCTWPVDTLMYSYASGFDSVVIHYQHVPLTCQDYGVVMLFDNMTVTPIITGITKNEIPVGFGLKQNYPNPFNPSTRINYQIPKQGMVTLKVYDITGNEVATLVNEVEQPGDKSVNFNASDLASGVYYYKLQSGNYTDTKKLVLLK
jgi:hypothetical protein